MVLYSKDLKSSRYKDISAPMLIATLVSTVKTRKPPNCSSMDEQRNCGSYDN
jgi:hypothetical protein